jgi:branched-chain amino acid transport system ATP-binding protein
VKLELKDVEKHFGGLQVIKGVNLTIDEPQLVGLIGPNGAGKTTLTNIIDGVYKPNSGEVWLNGERIDGLPPYQIARRGLGRTFQVLHPAAKRHEVVDKANEILEFLTIDHLVNEFGRGLSGGQQKLLELGRLLMLDPQFIILDEPFAGVHPKLQETIYEYIRKVRDEGKAVIIISHDMSSIFALSERLIVLDFGDIIADGHPDEVKDNPAVIAAYLGVDEEE